MKIAIVCDWITNLGGAERVIHALHQRYPSAPIFTSLYNPKKAVGFEKADIRPSYLQKIPFAKSHHQLLLPFMPSAIESFDLDEFDVVISSSHSVAKGIVTRPETRHISYCHTPMRYAWEHWEIEARLKNIPKIFHGLIKGQLHKIRLWDRLSAERVDTFLCNSTYVRDRIWKYYRKQAMVLHPPVDVCRFSIGSVSDYFLMVGRMIPYKRFDLVIETFNQTGQKLQIAGEGPEYKHLRQMARSNVKFLGRVTDDQLAKLYQECLALIFPQLEDFGLAPIECMASGRPVIAYGVGGVVDSIVENVTGHFFHEQTVQSLLKALTDFRSRSWNAEKIRKHAEQFSNEEFFNKLDGILDM